MSKTPHRRAQGALFLSAALGACGAGDSNLRPEPRAGTDADDVALSFLELGVPNAAAPQRGVLVAGQLTPEQFDRLPGIGVSKVINLRVADEEGTGWEEGRAAQRGIEFVRLPVAGAEAVDRAHAEALAGEIVGVEGPVLVYCGSANRVGALFALDAFHNRGASLDQALELGRRHGMTRLEPVVEERLGEALDQPR